MTEVALLLQIQELMAERKQLMARLNQLPIIKEYQSNKQLYESMLSAQRQLIDRVQQDPHDASTREQLEDIKMRLSKQRDLLVLLKSEGQSQYQSLKDDIEQIPIRIEEIKKKIRPETWQQFEQLLAKHPGRAVAQVRRGHCLGCGMSVPQATLTRIRSGYTSLVHCDHCGRLLIWD